MQENKHDGYKTDSSVDLIEKYEENKSIHVQNYTIMFFRFLQYMNSIQQTLNFGMKKCLHLLLKLLIIL